MATDGGVFLCDFLCDCDFLLVQPGEVLELKKRNDTCIAGVSWRRDAMAAPYTEQRRGSFRGPGRLDHSYANVRRIRGLVLERLPHVPEGFGVSAKMIITE
jgi:hypothetical protein